MECFWRLYCNWQSHGHCYHPNSPVFYLYIFAYNGFSGYYLPHSCFLEKYQKVYLGGEEKPVVLSLIQIKQRGYLKSFFNTES